MKERVRVRERDSERGRVRILMKDISKLNKDEVDGQTMK